jgi:hypothetical protein
LGCEVSRHQSQLAGGLAEVDGLLRLLSGDTTGVYFTSMQFANTEVNLSCPF